MNDPASSLSRIHRALGDALAALAAELSSGAPEQPLPPGPMWDDLNDLKGALKASLVELKGGVFGVIPYDRAVIGAPDPQYVTVRDSQSRTGIQKDRAWMDENALIVYLGVLTFPHGACGSNSDIHVASMGLTASLTIQEDDIFTLCSYSVAGGEVKTGQDIYSALNMLGLNGSGRLWIGTPAPSKWKCGGMIPNLANARRTIMDFGFLLGGTALASFRNAKMQALGMMSGDTDETVTHVASAIAVSAGRADLADPLAICMAIAWPADPADADPAALPLNSLLSAVFSAAQSFLDAFESKEIAAFDKRRQAAVDAGVWSANGSQVGSLIHFVASSPPPPDAAAAATALANAAAARLRASNAVALAANTAAAAAAARARATTPALLDLTGYDPATAPTADVRALPAVRDGNPGAPAYAPTATWPPMTATPHALLAPPIDHAFRPLDTPLPPPLAPSPLESLRAQLAAIQSQIDSATAAPIGPPGPPASPPATAAHLPVTPATLPLPLLGPLAGILTGIDALRPPTPVGSPIPPDLAVWASIGSSAALVRLYALLPTPYIVLADDPYVDLTGPGAARAADRATRTFTTLHGIARTELRLQPLTDVEASVALLDITFSSPPDDIGHSIDRVGAVSFAMALVKQRRAAGPAPHTAPTDAAVPPTDLSTTKPPPDSTFSPPVLSTKTTPRQRFWAVSETAIDGIANNAAVWRAHGAGVRKPDGITEARHLLDSLTVAGDSRMSVSARAYMYIVSSGFVNGETAGRNAHCDTPHAAHHPRNRRGHSNVCPP